MPKCPNCNVTLEWDDTFDVSVGDDEVYVYIAGHCENCNKDFTWREIFTFKEVDSLREA